MMKRKITALILLAVLVATVASSCNMGGTENGVDSSTQTDASSDLGQNNVTDVTGSNGTQGPSNGSETGDVIEDGTEMETHTGGETDYDSGNSDSETAETESESDTEYVELYLCEYVDPERVSITDEDGNAKNLILIYLESMETTYASTDVGGAQSGINYIPNLTRLAEEHTSFSDCDGLGGFRSVSGTGWTMGALLGTSSGIPFSLAVFGENSNNSLGKDGNFMNSLTTLGDILADKGYAQEFLCGSSATFGGRKTYYTVHGDYDIFDLYTARREGYVASDYHNDFWGFEDEYLYEIAKDEILELSRGDEPFNFTMLTVDTHHVAGYICELCGDEYSEQLANVVSCADRQIKAFIDWCVEQDFYEDTAIVILGDHPRMDSRLVRGVDYYDRTMYNCFINPAVEPKDVNDRVFTSLDVFPTVLSAMGFEIKGERLGLGVNMFSDVPTLCERRGGREGYEWLDAEVQKFSQYYKDNFADKKEE